MGCSSSYNYEGAPMIALADAFVGNLGWTLLGALLSLLLYVLYEHVRLLRRPSSFFQSWQSAWQPAYAPGWEWVTEELEIRRNSWMP